MGDQYAAQKGYVNVGVVAYIGCQLAIVQVALEDDKFGLLEIVVQLWCLGWQTPEATSCGPVPVRAHHQAALSMVRNPLLEKELHILDLNVGKWRRCLILKSLILRLSLEESSWV